MSGQVAEDRTRQVRPRALPKNIVKLGW